MRCYRQGDVLLVAVKAAPEPGVSVGRQDGRLVLADGEVSGHAHAIVAERAHLVSDELADQLYLLVHGDDVKLEHEEHDTVTVPPGIYRVVRQWEYVPEHPLVTFERERARRPEENYRYVAD